MTYFTKSKLSRSGLHVNKNIFIELHHIHNVCLYVSKCCKLNKVHTIYVSLTATRAALELLRNLD